MSFYNAGKCDACQCHLTLVKDAIDDISQIGVITNIIIGHDQKCKVTGDPW